MNKNEKRAAVVGIGLAAVAAAAAGAYFFTGKKGAKNRKAVAKWATDAKKEIVEELGKAEKVSKKAYHEIVKKVAAKYQSLPDVDGKELKTLAADAKKHWDKIAKEVKKAATVAAKEAAKAAKEAAKSAKKSVKPAKKTGKKK